MNQYSFYLSGTHCAACKIFIEDTFSQEVAIYNPRVDLIKEMVFLETDSTESPDTLAKRLTQLIRQNGYSVSIEKKLDQNNNQNLIWPALAIGLSLLGVFFGLQKSGILNIGLGEQITPITAFIIGLIASVSSCLAVVGGLVLSLSAQISRDRVNDTKSFTIFHCSRLLSFALLGGLLGMIGGVISINATFSSLLGLVAALAMLLLGLNLVGLLNNRLAIPTRIFSFLRKIEHQALAPLLLGVATFFLPCGFTQSMQIVALSSGSFVSGLLIMLFFALGTLPMLLALSFGAASFAQSQYAPLFFKSVGVVVVGLGLFALLSSLVSLGIISPLFNI